MPTQTIAMRRGKRMARTDDYDIPPRPVTWAAYMGAMFGVAAMFTLAAQPVVEQLSLVTVQAQNRILDGLDRSRVQYRQTGDQDDAPRITYEEIMLLNAPTDEPTRQRMVVLIHTVRDAFFTALVEGKTFSPPDYAPTINITGLGCGAPMGNGNSSSGGCHVCTLIGGSSSERNRQSLSRFLKRLSRTSRSPLAKLAGWAAGEPDLDVFALNWFRTWPREDRKSLLRTVLEDRRSVKRLNERLEKNLRQPFDFRTHLVSKVIERAVMVLDPQSAPVPAFG